jgi:CheY-like chemotaxis protein
MRTILIVDDSEPIALILARHLRGAGYRASLASDGASALASLERHVPDCILLDLMMPVMTGVELLHRLKANPAWSTIPVVLVTSQIGIGRTHYMADRGADYSVGKPFTRQQVLAAVDAALREREVCPAAAFAVA